MLRNCACGNPCRRHSTVCRECFNKKCRDKYASNELVRQKTSAAQKASHASGAKRLLYSYHRFKAYEVLGGPKCSKCGFADHRALQIDHIANDGAVRRKLTKEAGLKLYRQVIATNGAGFQVLCANCNWIKKAEHEGLGVYPETVPLPFVRRGRAPNAKPEDTYLDFVTEVPMRSVALKHGISRNTLALWWRTKFGEERCVVRNRVIQAKAASLTGRRRKSK